SPRAGHSDNYRESASARGATVLRCPTDNERQLTQMPDGRRVQLHQVRSFSAICSTVSIAPEATAIIKSNRSSSLASTHSPLRPRNTWQAVHASRLLPSTRAWLRHKECKSAAALVWISG